MRIECARACTYETVHGRVGLGLDVTALGLTGLDSSIDQALVSGLVCSSEDERRVGRRVLGLVDIDS